MYHLLYVLNMYILLLIAHPCFFIPLHDTIAFTSGPRTAFGEWSNHLYFIQVHILLLLSMMHIHVSLGCAVLLCLVCLTLLASFFLPSHLSLKSCMWYVLLFIALPCLFIPLHHTIAFTSGPRTAFSEWSNHLYFIQVHILLSLSMMHIHVCLGCAVLLCLVCLTLLAYFFLPSHLSLKTCMWYVLLFIAHPCLFIPLHHTIDFTSGPTTAFGK